MSTTPARPGPSARERFAADGPAPTNADRLILWLARRQWRTLVAGVLFGIPWMLASALVPAAIGRAIDDGIVAQDGRALVQWSAAIFGLGLVAAVTTNLRHYFAVYNWMNAAFRSSLVADASVRRAGPALTRHLPAGEVITSFSTDMGRMGHVFDVSARFAGAIVSFVVVSVILLRGSVLLGLIMLIGGPVLLASLALVMRPLQRRQTAQREEQGRLTSIGADTVAGLRVLRGIGGEDAFMTRYVRQSARVQTAGVRISGVQATLDAAQVLLPGIFVAIVTGVGAHLALAGEIRPGQLVAYYGYTAFLTMPLRTATEFVDKLISTRVAARRIVRIIGTTPDHPSDGTGSVAVPLAVDADLTDHRSGIVIRGGHLTALVCADPDVSARLAARLGRTLPGPSEVSLGGVPLDDLAIEEVRGRVLVSESDPRLFSGDLRAEIGPGRSDADILAALEVASAADVLDSLEGGLEGRLSERGRALSGGQRQRLALARALLRDPDVLVLVEPTSAVDAHTEARIAGRLRAYRERRTTVVTTASPLLLDQADEVIVLDARPGGPPTAPTVVARGRHRDLITDNDTYRSIVIRGEDETHALTSHSLA